MTDQEILAQALYKAFGENIYCDTFYKLKTDTFGWGSKYHPIDEYYKTNRKKYDAYYELRGSELTKAHWGLWAEVLIRENYYKLLLTDHAFCKAFWGEDPWCEECNKPLEKIDITEHYGGKKHTSNQWACLSCSKAPPISFIPWQYGLQQMVITDNWLQYIKQFLEDK